jgi:hypothetical protein
MQTMTKTKTSTVLAGAYKNQSHKTNLTHAVEYGADGWLMRVMCKRVDPDSMTAEHESDASDEKPTCPVCAKKVK